MAATATAPPTTLMIPAPIPGQIYDRGRDFSEGTMPRAFPWVMGRVVGGSGCERESRS